MRTGGGPGRLLAADLNGDGALDLASADWIDDQLSIFLGQGDGTFPGPHPPALRTGIRPRALLAADLNGDGALDLASTDGQHSIFLGQGDGTFPGPHPPAWRTRDPVALLAADLNGDGALDLASADLWGAERSGQLSILLGRGDGTFPGPHPPAFWTGNSPVALLAADLNGDGALDLASADQGSNQLSIFLGQGDGTFPGPHPAALTTGRAPSALLAADLNGDGTLDVASADVGPPQLSIFLQAARRPLPRPFFGSPRASVAWSGDGRGGVLHLEARARPYRIHTGTGTLDGAVSPGFLGHAFHFASVTVDPGAVLLALGDSPLVLLVEGDVAIEGEIRAAGEAGADAGLRPGGAGGAGGPGGGRGGPGGGAAPGSGSLRGRRGEGGGGGGGGGRVEIPFARGSGAGGGHATRGGDAGETPGGSSYGNPLLNPLFGGSGGGGGSARDQDGALALNHGDDGGGGGGGGGGALRITAGGSITVSGKVVANGGGGGRGNAGPGGQGGGGHGGGGAGGSILLQARGQIRILSGALVSAAGGKGAFGGESPPGGDGGDGRVRFEDADGALENQGAIIPPGETKNVGTLPSP